VIATLGLAALWLAAALAMLQLVGGALALRAPGKPLVAAIRPVAVNPGPPCRPAGTGPEDRGTPRG